MPFTPAHPMAVLPILRWRVLDPTCLAIGAMAPDFEYFIHGQQKGAFGHTVTGIALWGVPVTLIVAFAFHMLVKWPLVAVVPESIARRALRAAAMPWPRRWSLATLASCIASAAIGDVTHIVWDSFTHSNSWGERHFPIIDRFVSVPVLGAMPISRVLQYGCSVIGLAVVIWFVARALRRERAGELPELARGWSRVIFAACVLGGIAALTFRLTKIHATDPGSIVVAVISGLLGGTLVASIVLHALGIRLQAAVIHGGPGLGIAKR